MKLKSRIIPVLLGGLCLASLNAQQTAPVSDATILGRIADGTASKPAAKPPLPIFKVQQSIVRQMDVVEALKWQVCRP